MKYKNYNIALDVLDRQLALGRGDQEALIFVRQQGRRLFRQRFSFRELALLTDKACIIFRRKNGRVGDRVLIRLPNSPEFPIAFLGAIKAGLIPVPVSPLLTAPEMHYLRKDSGAKFCVDEEWEWDFEKIERTCFSQPVTRGDDPAYWLYTSGTEGRPKAVVHAHRSIPAHDGRVKLWQNAGPGDVVFNTSALNWSYALTSGMLDLWRHGITSLVYRGDPDPETLCLIIKTFGVTTFMSVPGIYRKIVGNLEASGTASKSFQSVRACLSAGEKLSPEIRARFYETTRREIYEGLGMTEHSVYLVQSFGKKIIDSSCGRPLPGTRLKILNPDKEGIGVLAAHRNCPGLMLGYRGSPIRGEWFATNDLARRDRKGNYYFIGRRDDVITAGGYRISPVEVESVLNRHPDILESAVVEKKSSSSRTCIAAYVVPRKGKEWNSGRILKDISKQLAKYKLPREIIRVSHLPKTVNGKILRRQLKGEIYVQGV